MRTSGSSSGADDAELSARAARVGTSMRHLELEILSRDESETPFGPERELADGRREGDTPWKVRRTAVRRANTNARRLPTAARS
jgi:hypothetical protein